MKKIAEFIANHSVLILVICALLLIPSIFGYVNTRINYDILVYLPDNIETIRGENILNEDFGLGSYAFVMVDSTNNKRILDLENKIKDIKGVNQVFSLADVVDTMIPIEMLPSKVTDKLNKDNETIIMVTFLGTTSEDLTLEAVSNLREVVGDATKVSSMTSMVIDTKNLSNQEILSYVIIAVALCLLVLLLATDSYIIPFFLLGNIGVSILYNMGSNIFLGEISYITKAITAILQLGVTMDFSIFLYHKYEQAKEENPKLSKNEAMALAIRATFTSIIGSSLTTFAGFLALCTMSLTLGADIGIVMAKGVLFGLICVLTLFPSLLLVFDKLIIKTKHKNHFPKFTKLQTFCVKYHKAIIACFLVLLIPVLIGNNNYEVYYKLDESLPSDLAFNVANSNLAQKFNIVSPEIILLDKAVKTNDVMHLVEELKKVDGIDLVLSPSTLMDRNIIELLPNDLTKMIENDKYQLIIVNSNYEIASDELNKQLKIVNDLVKKYDQDSIIAGEGPLMNDLVTIADHDFRSVNFTSILVIFVIMALVLKQITLPVILILAIEFAIFTNLAISYYTGTTLPFIASIVVGTIQLGATVDYAILMSTKYLELRKTINNKNEAITSTLFVTVPSIITSALCFFAATFGVAIYTKIDMIGAICKLLARGSIISMLVVITLLPALLLTLDNIIVKRKKEEKNMKNIKKGMALLLILALIVSPFSALALTKSETIFTSTNYNNDNNKTVVSNHLYDIGKDSIDDVTFLTNIINLNGNEKYELDNNKLIWQNNGNDIIYQGTTDRKSPIDAVTKIYFNNKLVKNIDDIKGKSGKVRLELKLKNNSYNKKENVYVPYVVTMGMILNNDQNNNIKITNGKVVSTGTRSILVALATPGLYESINISNFKNLDKVTITYDTTNFDFNEIYMMASPKLLSEVDFNIFSEMDKLAKSVNLLSTSMDNIENGTKVIKSKSKELENGAKNLSDSLNIMATEVKKIENGMITVDDGLEKIITVLESSLQESADLKLLNKTNEASIKSLEETQKNLKENYNKYGLKNFQTTSELIAFFNNQGLSNEAIESLINCKIIYENTKDSNENLIKLIATNNEALLKLNKEVAENMNNLLEQLKNIKAGTSKLAAGAKALDTNLIKLYNGSNNLQNGIMQLNAGFRDIHDGITKVNADGIKVLERYTNQFTSYSNSFKSLVKASKNYKGYATNNASNTTLIYKISK